MADRPRGRETHVTGKGTVQKRGEGLHSGPVGGGRPSGGSGRTGGPGGPGRPAGGSGGQRAGGGGKSPLMMIIILVIALLGGGGGAASLLGGGGGSSSGGYTQQSNAVNSSYLFGGGSGSMGSSSANGGWVMKSNCGQLDTSIASGTRTKYTQIRGNGRDTNTILVYMCGTDLESRSGMATSDLQEMAKAKLSDKVNVIVYTGGCNQWKNNSVSSKVNQIYQIKNGGLKCLVDNAGRGAMTDPGNLAEFIKWGYKNFPADRMDLILWDHGGGSLTGYGYDEKNSRSGSMTLAGIEQALSKAGVTFDFIGFDACLMATVETGLMLNDYADYMVASEETEPGVGWYYTDWLTELSADPSMSTLDVGRNICDDFVSTCNRQCRGQQTTLSVVDLAELAKTVPPALTNFARSTSSLIEQRDYKVVSDARYGAREFAKSSKIDQIDMVHFAANVGTDAGRALTEAILGAVKYNQTSSNMTNAYGLSIYFPCGRSSKVDSAVRTYSSIGMDSEYSNCIKKFASMQTAGQAAGGGSYTASPMSGLGILDMLASGASGSSNSTLNTLGTLAGMATGSTSGSDAIVQLLGTMMNGQTNISGLSGSNLNFFTGRSLDINDMADYIADNQFDPAALAWTENEKGETVIHMSDEQWGLVHDLALSVFYDDGEGYVDLGLDNVFNFTEDGDLLAETDGSWLAINGQTVPYYFDNMIDDGENYTINGHIPVLLNGERADLKIVFDSDEPYGYIAGAVPVYTEGETETIAKALIQLEEGDTLDFICDYYTYDGEYQDSYFLGEQMTVTADMEISNVELEKASFNPMYRFTDIYEQVYWTDIF